MTEQMKEHLLKVGKGCDEYEILPKPSEMLMMGVEHFIRKLWHDASEEPNGYNSIIIAYDNGCTVEPSLKDFKSYSEWPTIKKLYRVKKWCYLEDIVNEKE